MAEVRRASDVEEDLEMQDAPPAAEPAQQAVGNPFAALEAEESEPTTQIYAAVGGTPAT